MKGFLEALKGYQEKMDVEDHLNTRSEKLHSEDWFCCLESGMGFIHTHFHEYRVNNAEELLPHPIQKYRDARVNGWPRVGRKFF